MPLLQSQTNANVEVYQQYPDGVPRKVFISGPPECVDLAAVMVEEVIFATHLPEGITLYFFPGIRLLSLSGGSGYTRCSCSYLLFFRSPHFLKSK